MKFSVLSLALAATLILSSPSCYAQDALATGEKLPAITVPRESKVPLTNSMNALQSNDSPPSLSSTSYTRKRRHLARLDSSSYDSSTANMVPESQRQPSLQQRRHLHLVNRRLRIRNSGPQRLVAEKRGLLDDLVGQVPPATAAPSPTNGKVQELSGRGDEQEVSEGEPEPSPLQEETPEEEDTNLEFPSPYPSPPSPPPIELTSTPAPSTPPPSPPSPPSPPPPPPTSSEQPPPTSEQPPSTTEERPITTTTEPEPTTPPQPTQEPVDPPSPVAPPASNDDTPSTRTRSSATDNSAPTAGTPGTSQSTAGSKPSTVPTAKNESGGNKTSITIGVVIAAILISAGIGVWVFRKWKLSPSRQFKSKIRSGSIGGGAAAVAIRSGHGDNPSEYNSYDNIFRPQPHESTVPMTMAGAAATTGVSTMGGMPANEYEYESYDYPSQPPMAHQYHHQPHMSMSSAAGSVTDYGQYRYPPSTSSLGYDPNVVAHSMAAHGGGSPGSGHHLHGYGSQDYSQNDQFLRELRE